MSQLWMIIQQQHTEIITALEQHIELSLLALLIAALIAIPLAIILMNHRRVAELILQITGVFQTIPSLALLGLLIPFVGIGKVPSIIALVIYAIMPIFQNTYSGFISIEPSLEEAATAFGLSRRRKLFRLELPLAMPMIISGVRIALVMIIGTATLAALIGAGGLGTYILQGIETNNNYFLVIGAGLSAILALIFSAVIKALSRLSIKKMLITLVGFFILIGVYATFQAVSTPPATITIAGKLGSEPEILINMYRDLIKAAHPDYQVTLKPNFGGTTFLFNALKANQIDIYPEFTGTVMDSIVDKKGVQVTNNPQKTYQNAEKLLKTQFQMSYLKPMSYENSYSIATTKAFAKQNHLEKISDLVRLSGPVTAGFDADFYGQDAGYKGLQKAYHLTFDAKMMESSMAYKAISEGRVNLIDAYTTDANLRKYDLVILKDDLHYFPPYQGAPLLKAATLEKYPDLKKILNQLSGRITTLEMQEMNYQVQVKHQKASKVARDYLVKAKLIQK